MNNFKDPPTIKNTDLDMYHRRYPRRYNKPYHSPYIVSRPFYPVWYAPQRDLLSKWEEDNQRLASQRLLVHQLEKQKELQASLTETQTALDKVQQLSAHQIHAHQTKHNTTDTDCQASYSLVATITVITLLASMFALFSRTRR